MTRVAAHTGGFDTLAGGFVQRLPWSSGVPEGTVGARESGSGFRGLPRG
jgi:hypothetical protein